MSDDEQSCSDTNSGEKTLPEPSEAEMVQLLAAQQTIMDNYRSLDAEYKANVRELARKYGVDHPALDGDEG